MATSTQAALVPKATDADIPKSAVNSDLSADESKRALTAGLGFLGIAAVTASFSEPNASSGIISKNVQVTVPSGTQRIFVYLGNWDFSFGRPGYIERPLSRMVVRFRVNWFSGKLVTFNVRTLLRDINADDAWEANVEVVVACFG